MSGGLHPFTPYNAFLPWLDGMPSKVLVGQALVLPIINIANRLCTFVVSAGGLAVINNPFVSSRSWLLSIVTVVWSKVMTKLLMKLVLATVDPR